MYDTQTQPAKQYPHLTHQPILKYFMRLQNRVIISELYFSKSGQNCLCKYVSIHTFWLLLSRVTAADISKNIK